METGGQVITQVESIRGGVGNHSGGKSHKGGSQDLKGEGKVSTKIKQEVHDETRHKNEHKTTMTKHEHDKH